MTEQMVSDRSIQIKVHTVCALVQKVVHPTL